MQANLYKQKRTSGFSLVEVLMAVVLIAIGVTGLLSAMAAGTQTNAAGRDLATGSFLAQEIREYTLTLPFYDPQGEDSTTIGPNGSNPVNFVDDLNDMKNVTYSPPIDGQFNKITDMADWSQTVTVSWRDPKNLTKTVADGSSEIVYVEVTIKHGSESVLTTGWIVAE
ncbi:MAG: prepilin-type N-terminal cleavage/methylation domain-containing protein [Phycisphaerae bacterium]